MPDQILDQIIQIVIQMLDSGEQIEPELEELLIEILRDELSAGIQAEGAGAPLPTEAGKIPSGEYPSSNVEGFKFDPKTKRLHIQFHGPYPQSKGPIYEYENVPDYIYSLLERGAVGPKTSGRNRYHEWKRGVTPSYGAAVNALIKAGKYDYRKVG